MKRLGPPNFRSNYPRFSFHHPDANRNMWRMKYYSPEISMLGEFVWMWPSEIGIFAKMLKMIRRSGFVIRNRAISRVFFFYFRVIFFESVLFTIRAFCLMSSFNIILNHSTSLTWRFYMLSQKSIIFVETWITYHFCNCLGVKNHATKHKCRPNKQITTTYLKIDYH